MGSISRKAFRRVKSSPFFQHSHILGKCSSLVVVLFMLGHVLVTSQVTYNFGQVDIQRIGPQNKVALPETKS